MPFANTRYVDAVLGHDVNFDGTSPTPDSPAPGNGPWKTFQKADTAAPSDCEIIFADGAYDLSAGLYVLDGTKSLRLFRAANYGGAVVSLAAGASPSFDTLLTGDTEIQGFIFEALSGAPASAIRIAQNNVAKANNKLRSCEVYTVGGNAVVMGGADNTNGCEVAYVLAESTGTHATFNGAIMAREDFTGGTFDHVTAVAYHASAHALDVVGAFASNPTGLVVKNSILAGAGPSVINVVEDWVSGWPGRYAGNNNAISKHLGAAAIAKVGAATDVAIADWKTRVAPDDSVSIDADPLWVDAGADDYRLQAASPAATLDDAGGAAGAFGVVPGAVPRRRPGVLNPLLGIGV